jgi:hypothetical protein
MEEQNKARGVGVVGDRRRIGVGGESSRREEGNEGEWYRSGGGDGFKGWGA